MIGVNGNLAAFDRPWHDQNLVEAFIELDVSNLRYPAGTLGNYWDWETGALDRSVPDSLMIPWVVENKFHKSSARYTLENLALAHRQIGFTPVFMLNMLSKDLDHAVTHLLRAQKLGLPIRYIELGNEFYFGLHFERSRFPSPEEYGKTSSKWIDSLKQHFPNAKYAVIGTYLERDSRQRNWTKRVLEYCKNADAVTFHTYSPAGIDGRLERKRFKAGTEGTDDHRTATRYWKHKSLKERQSWELSLLKDESAYANFLQSAIRSAKRYKMMDVPEGMEIWATEFNMRADSSALRGTWANTLYTAKYYDTFLQGPIRLTNIHNLTGALFPQVYTDQNQLGHVLTKQVSTTPYSLSAQGIATSLYAGASKGMNKVAPLIFPDMPKIEDDRRKQLVLLSGWRFSKETQHTYLVVNYSSMPHTVFLPISGQNVRYLQYHAPLEHYIANGFKTPKSQTGITDSELVLRPYSLTLIK